MWIVFTAAASHSICNALPSLVEELYSKGLIIIHVTDYDWLVCVCVCVYVSVREWERVFVCVSGMSVCERYECVWVCVCVWERESVFVCVWVREIVCVCVWGMSVCERESVFVCVSGMSVCVFVCVRYECVCVCVRERERECVFVCVSGMSVCVRYECVCVCLCECERYEWVWECVCVWMGECVCECHAAAWIVGNRCEQCQTVAAIDVSKGILYLSRYCTLDHCSSQGG